jgi:hypothetical protein
MSELEFSVPDAAPAQRSAQPAVVFRVHVRNAGEPVEAMVLHAGVRIEPQWRSYDAQAQTQLADLFGTPDRWDKTLHVLTWAEVAVMVRGFDRESHFDVRVPCTYDFDASVTRYFSAVDEGTIPVRMLFSGSIFRRSPHGFSAQMVPWSCECAYSMPASLWKAAMQAVYGDAVLLHIDRATFDRLRELRAHLGLTSWDATIAALLAAREGELA